MDTMNETYKKLAESAVEKYKAHLNAEYDSLANKGNIQLAKESEQAKVEWMQSEKKLKRFLETE